MKMTSGLRITRVVACAFALAACGGSDKTPSPTAGAGSSAVSGNGGSVAHAGTGGSGAAGTHAGSGGAAGGAAAGGAGSAAVGGAGGTSGGAKAMATISPFMSAPAAGAGGSAAGTGGTGGVSAGHGGSGAGGGGAGGSAGGAGGAGGSSAAGPITGTAVFTATATGVDVMITINGCVDTKSYPVHIHEGSSCADVASQGPHWGAAAAATAGSGGSGGGAAGSAGSAGASGTAGSGGAAGAPAMLLRGEGIPEIACKGTTGTTMLSRANTDPKLAWSVGGDTTTNVVGHVVVVHDPVAKTPRIACGKITM
jgi:hypothetical protein